MVAALIQRRTFELAPRPESAGALVRPIYFSRATRRNELAWRISNLLWSIRRENETRANFPRSAHAAEDIVGVETTSLQLADTAPQRKCPDEHRGVVSRVQPSSSTTRGS